MNDKRDETSEGLNQIIEIINAKGDVDELKEIVEKPRLNSNNKQADIPE